MKFRPLHDRVIIWRAEGVIKSRGWIVIPDTAEEKPQEGEGPSDHAGSDIPGLGRTRA